MAQLHLWSKIRTKLSLDDGPFIIFAPDLWYFIDLDALFYKMFRILFIFEILENTTEKRKSAIKFRVHHKCNIRWNGI